MRSLLRRIDRRVRLHMEASYFALQHPVGLGAVVVVVVVQQVLLFLCGGVTPQIIHIP